MPQALVAIALVGHGLITTAIGFGTLTNTNAAPMAVPAWLAWWPGPFGRSWLFEALSLGTGASLVGGVLWLAAGLLLVAGGLGWFGIGPVEAVRVPLLVAGAGVGLLALALYFHPLYLLAVAINVAIAVVAWGELSARAA